MPVRFPEATFAELRAWAAREGLTMSALIRRLVDDALGRHHPPDAPQAAEAAEPDALARLDTAMCELEALRRQVGARRR